MNIIPHGLNMSQGMIMPLILLVAFLVVPAIPVMLLPKAFNPLKRVLYGLLALVAFYVWAKVILPHHF